MMIFDRNTAVFLSNIIMEQKNFKYSMQNIPLSNEESCIPTLYIYIYMP